MAQLAIPFMLAGTAVSFAGGMRQASAIRAAGKAKQVEAEYMAKQQEALAVQDVASSQRKFLSEKRKLQLAESRGRALAGKGGGLDNAYADVMSVLATEGNYRKDFALYEGKDSALSRKDTAALGRYQGLQERNAANARAKAVTISTIGNTMLSLGSIGLKSKAGKKGEDG